MVFDAYGCVYYTCMEAYAYMCVSLNIKSPFRNQSREL